MTLHREPQTPLDGPHVRSAVGRSDLLRVVTAFPDEDRMLIAELLGFKRASPPVDHRGRVVPSTSESSQEDRPFIVPIVDDTEPTFRSTPPRPVPFWMASRYESFPKVEEVRHAGYSERESKRLRATRPAPPRFDPLASGPELQTRLRAGFSRLSPTNSVDVDRYIDRLSRFEEIPRIPYKFRRRWGDAIHLVVDRGDHLKPYWSDQDLVLRLLRTLYPHDGFEVAWFEEAHWEPTLIDSSGRHGPYRFPNPGTTVLVLSDLGLLRHGGGPTEVFRPFAERWWRDGCPTFVLNPSSYRPETTPRQHWKFIPWEGALQPRPLGGEGTLDHAMAKRVLALLSFAVRLEPQLIRAARRILQRGRLDAGVEALVWNDEAISQRDYKAACFDPDRRKSLRNDFDDLDPSVREPLLHKAAAIRNGVYPGILHAEVLGLGKENAALIGPDAHDAACDWFRERLDELTREVPGGIEGSVAFWYRRVVRPALESNQLNDESIRLLSGIWNRVTPLEGGPATPSGYSSRSVVPVGERKVRLIELRQVGDRITASEFDPSRATSSAGDLGSHLALIRARDPRLRIEEIDPFWERGAPPEWAEQWGWDQFGRWVTLRVGRAVQKLRWVPPGSFWMGSPEDEPGRFSFEGVRRRETIERGFWMFDTPCAQALWEEVAGENPSEFRSPDRPVENVSWDDCHKFIQRINARFPDLKLGLPFEAQWEYACRARTETATYAGPIEIKGTSNAPVLDPIAWYGGNSGVGFELDNGGDAWWGEKQYEFKRAGTHPVGRKLPNAWGLYDTLGNVWEWCADTWDAASADRVIRGGSWRVNARFVRAAYRSLSHPSLRYDFIGVRFSEFGESSVVSSSPASERSREAEAGRGASRSGAEQPTPKPKRGGGARAAFSLAPGAPGGPFDGLTPVSVASDLERVNLDVVVRPGWASAIGRDRFGLWADLEIEPIAKKKPPVRQRLRWIPPGRARLGSPKDEPGRRDWEQEPREVVFREGFWMYDTPCSQAVWEAVTGDNPSRFRTPARPVENVSWEMCMDFVNTINVRLEEIAGGGEPLRLALPSEAQWEYACRAGTETATYAGEIEIKGEHNASVLDSIAWYGGNSGVDFELDNGWDASGWSEKQYKFTRAGTHPVGLKLPNAWGLYDTLGNVWEWCADKWDAASADRVIRGGSWYDNARLVRAAYHDHPSFRDVNVGVRFSEFRESSVVSSSPASERSREAEAGRGASRSGAEQPPTKPKRRGGARRGPNDKQGGIP